MQNNQRKQNSPAVDVEKGESLEGNTIAKQYRSSLIEEKHEHNRNQNLKGRVPFHNRSLSKKPY